jgi:hypothetical protein
MEYQLRSTDSKLLITAAVEASSGGAATQIQGGPKVDINNYFFSL